MIERTYVIRTRTNDVTAQYACLETESPIGTEKMLYMSPFGKALTYHDIKVAVRDMFVLRDQGHDVAVFEREVVETCVAL